MNPKAQEITFGDCEGLGEGGVSWNGETWKQALEFLSRINDVCLQVGPEYRTPLLESVHLAERAEGLIHFIKVILACLQ